MIVLFFACNDYSIFPKTDSNTRDDIGSSIDTSASSNTEEDLSCEDREYEGFAMPLDESCFMEPVIMPLSPVVKWKKNSWTTGEGFFASVSLPLVGQFTDDNQDGLINAEDSPDILIVGVLNDSNDLMADSSITYLRLVDNEGEEIWSV